MESIYSRNIKFTVFGASHAPEIGVIIEGLPYGFEPDIPALTEFLQRRAPGRSEFSTSRREADIPEFVYGLRDGKVCGAVKVIIRNTDVRREDYSELRSKPRPGHADLTARIKYGPDFDLSGGGHFSGRMTAPLCIVGGLCLQLLRKRGVTVTGRISELGGTADTGKMSDAVLSAKADGDSVGGIIECTAVGVPAGLGDAMFDGMESRISELVFGIPAVKAIEFGAGFAVARLRGSENNDPFRMDGDRVMTETNNCGGILGGITDGMPLVFRAAVKPTPSIGKVQRTVDLDKLENTELVIKGRHDPCIVPRALPCMEAAMGIAVFDALLETEKSGTLEEFRREIDIIDSKLVDLFNKRMEVVESIGEYKFARGLPVLDTERERERLDSVCSGLSGELSDEVRALYERIFELSRRRQSSIRDKGLRCGLLGRKLGHSYSPQIHSMLCPYEYLLYEKEPEELECFLRSGSFDGLNVTVPYKKAVAALCDELSDTARQLGSVNTVIRRADGTIYGDNTDFFGFEDLVRVSGICVRGKKALVLGTGGVSVTVCAVLRKLGAPEVVTISRSGEDNYENLSRHADAGVIVNATPVGMYPNTGESLLDLRLFPHCSGVLDVVYNPHRTALLLQAEELGIPSGGGLHMLVAQAKRSCALFTGSEMPDSEISRIESALLSRMRNIVLIGMPGCGKSTVAQALGKRLGREIVDIDSLIEARSGMSIPDIFSNYGEEHFRRLESEIISETGKRSGIIISTGGGCVTREENYKPLHQNGLIVLLTRELELLPRDGRPISQRSDMAELYRIRRPMYERFADVSVDNSGSPEEAVSAVLSAAERQTEKI